MHGMSGETVKRGIVEIYLHIRLVFGGKERGRVNRGTVNRDTTVPLTRAVARGTVGFQFCQQFFVPINIQRKFRNSTEQLLVIVMN